MGMAASQARLLTITARMSDLEFKAQTLQNAKLQLATQSDQVYQNYLAALDATSLTLTYTTSSGQTGYQAATFNNLCSRNRLDSADGTIYALRNKDGKLIVEDEIAEAYEEFVNGPAANRVASKDRDANSFAMFMMAQNAGGIYAAGMDYPGTNGNGICSNGYLGVQQAEEIIYQNIKNSDDYPQSTKDQLISLHDKLIEIIDRGFNADGTMGSIETYVENQLNDQDISNDNIPPAIYHTNELNPEDYAEYNEILQAEPENAEVWNLLGMINLQKFKLGQAFKDLLYQTAGDKILDKLTNTAPASGATVEFDNDLFNYYADIFAQSMACGGCVPISDYNGSYGDAASNSEWLQAQVECGNITIEAVKTRSRRSHIISSIDTVSVNSETSLSDMATSKLDNTALAKAEAKYDHDMKEINRKDKAFDLDLSKISSQREALKTEYDSIKKVVDDNIKRTFGIFS